VTAEKRLKVLSDLDSLGAGFQLASHDLDIRGAGNMLGDEQTGHIKEVGFELYQAMLEEAIMDAKSGGLASARPKDFSPQITVDAPILIPEEYVPDLDLRMGLYRRLNELEEGQEIEAFAAEMIDRFGPLPDATENLIRVIEIKLNAKRACVSKIDVGPRGVLVSFHNDTPPHIDKLLAYVERLNGVARLRPDSKLVLQRGCTVRCNCRRGWRRRRAERRRAQLLWSATIFHASPRRSNSKVVIPVSVEVAPVSVQRATSRACVGSIPRSSAGTKLSRPRVLPPPVKLGA